jgi:hypothetical protein
LRVHGRERRSDRRADAERGCARRSGGTFVRQQDSHLLGLNLEQLAALGSPSCAFAAMWLRAALTRQAHLARPPVGVSTRARCARSRNSHDVPARSPPRASAQIRASETLRRLPSSVRSGNWRCSTELDLCERCTFDSRCSQSGASAQSVAAARSRCRACPCAARRVQLVVAQERRLHAGRVARETHRLRARRRARRPLPSLSPG